MEGPRVIQVIFNDAAWFDGKRCIEIRTLEGKLLMRQLHPGERKEEEDDGSS